MKIDYCSKKWPKEVDDMKKFLKDCGGDYSKNEKTLIKDFEESSAKDYLDFYNCLYGEYMCMARYSYLCDINSTKCIEYTYLSGLAFIYVKKCMTMELEQNITSL